MANAEIAAIREMIAQFPMGSSVEKCAKLMTAQALISPSRPTWCWNRKPSAPCARNGVRPQERDNTHAMLFLHGGGYVIGSILSHRHLAVELGRAAGMRTLALDYRLAPEAPFPAAVDDATSAYRFLLDQGLKPASIAIAGDSAGGALTLAVLLAARDAGLPQPACGFLMSPWVDLEATGGSMASKAAEVFRWSTKQSCIGLQPPIQRR